MATTVARSLMPCTEFQLYVSELVPANVIDFTERRLLLCIERTKDAQHKMLLAALVDDYRARRVAVSWRLGRPVVLRMTSDA